MGAVLRSDNFVVCAKIVVAMRSYFLLLLQRQFRLTEASPTGKPSQSGLESQSLAYWRLASRGLFLTQALLVFGVIKSGNSVLV
jgi:hypothetical protein